MEKLNTATEYKAKELIRKAEGILQQADGGTTELCARSVEEEAECERSHLVREGKYRLFTLASDLNLSRRDAILQQTNEQRSYRD